MLALKQNIIIRTLKGGSALFNEFTGDSHFLTWPYELILSRLMDSPQPRESLLSGFCEQFDKQNVEQEAQFEQFISEAINSGIITETEI
jgi:PqqD family protein of HPr-rel-A system